LVNSNWWSKSAAVLPWSTAAFLIPGEAFPFQAQSIFFCNGPQCPQSPAALRELLDAGYPASSLAYYRGGMHDWVTLAMPTEPVS
jgi:rhodanese-related sulfurtransferase